MMSVRDQFRTAAQAMIPLVGGSLAPIVPEVVEAYAVALETKSRVSRYFLDYIQLVDEIVLLTGKDLAVIERARQISFESGEVPGSASHNNASDFFQVTTPDQRLQLSNLIRAAADPNSEFFPKGLGDLTDMMVRGHAYKQAGKTPTDGDPKADALIWGHTQLQDPKVLIEFTICHYIERYMTVAFQEMGLSMADHKDWFLNILTDVIALAAVKASHKRVVRSWSVPRGEESDDMRGLGWLKSDRIAAFQQAWDELASEA